MKNSLLFALLVACSASLAEPFQYEKPTWCDDHKVVVEALKSRYNETVVWFGKDLENDSHYAMTTNVNEGTWTLIQTNGKVACVLGAGTNSMPVTGEKI